MCIIIAKPAGVEPLDEGYFERAWNHNGDGGGVVWKSPENEDAHIQKGFMKKEEFLEKLKEINKKYSMNANAKKQKEEPEAKVERVIKLALKRL